MSSARQPLALFASLVAVSVLLAYGHELVRRDGRASLVESVTGTLCGQVVVVLGAGWVLLPTAPPGVTPVVAAGAAAAVAGLAALAPLDPDLQPWVMTGAGLVAAVLAGVATRSGHVVTALVVGACVSAVVTGLYRLLADQDAVEGVPGLLASAAAPVLAVGTVAYALARVVG